jgi:hypothetical protein
LEPVSFSSAQLSEPSQNLREDSTPAGFSKRGNFLFVGSGVSDSDAWQYNPRKPDIIYLLPSHSILLANKEILGHIHTIISHNFIVSDSKVLIILLNSINLFISEFKYKLTTSLAIALATLWSLRKVFHLRISGEFQCHYSGSIRLFFQFYRSFLAYKRKRRKKEEVFLKWALSISLCYYNIVLNFLCNRFCCLSFA